MEKYKNLAIYDTKALDCSIVEPRRFGDARGFFESITSDELKHLGFKNFSQFSDSMSGKGILRGLHYQEDPYCQAKMVRCVRGKVVDIVMDVRKDSDTYGKCVAVELTPENGRFLFVPRGFAHAYLALEDNSLFEYYVDNEYNTRREGGVSYKDPNMVINLYSKNEGEDEYSVEELSIYELLEKYGIDKPLISAKDEERTTLEQTDINFLRRPRRYLVTGVSGQLGYDVVKELQVRGETDILGVSSKQLDITDREKVMQIVKAYKPDIIFHCAAWTQVDKAEEEKELCEKVNVEGTKNLVDASFEVGAKIVYMSTDYVFDGTKEGCYNEEDTPNPQSVYGQTKYLGEEEVRRNPNHFITRISWVFGINGNNFVKTMIKLSDKYRELNVVDDQIGSPTYTVDLSKLLVDMAHTNKYGTYNATNTGYCTWAEFAEEIFNTCGLDVKVNHVSTDEYFKGKAHTTRPVNSKFNWSKLEENGFTKLPEWQDALRRYIKEFNESPEGKILSLTRGENK